MDLIQGQVVGNYRIIEVKRFGRVHDHHHKAGNDAQVIENYNSPVIFHTEIIAKKAAAKCRGLR